MWHMRLTLACVAIIVCHGMDESTVPVVGQTRFSGLWPFNQRLMYTAAAGWVSIRGQEGIGWLNSDHSVFVTEEKCKGGPDIGSRCVTFLYSTHDGHLIGGPLFGHCENVSANGLMVALRTPIFYTIRRYPDLPLPADEEHSNDLSDFGTLLFDTTTGGLRLMHGTNPQLNANGSRVVMRVGGGPLGTLNLRDTQTGALLAQINYAGFFQFNGNGTVFAVTQTIDCVAHAGLYDPETGRAICVVPGIFNSFSEDGRYMFVNSDTGDLWKIESSSGEGMHIIQGTFYATDAYGQQHAVTITGERKTIRYDVLTGHVMNENQ